jgi:hypothetical protein
VGLVARIERCPEMHTEFWQLNLREKRREYFADVDVDEKITLK